MSESHKYHAFISYSRLDFDEVNAFLQKLQSEVPEFEYWFDLEGIESGDEFEDKIVSAVDQSERVLFMLSDNSIKSKCTKKEVKYADNTGKRIIPVLLKGAKLKGWFLFTFGSIDYIDIQDSRQMSKLVSDLRQWCGAAPTKSETIEKNEPKLETDMSRPVAVTLAPGPVQSKNETEVPIPIGIGGKWGYKNKKGEIIIPCIYDCVLAFSEGRALVKTAGKWGFIDLNGNLAIPCIYDYVYGFTEGRAMVKTAGKCGFIDLNGNLAIPCIYGDAYGFSCGRALVEKDGKWGWIDVNGIPVIPFIYDNVFDFSEGRACVKKDGKWGFIDESGTLVIPCIYDYPERFSEGRARVTMGFNSFYIDKNGNRILGSFLWKNVKIGLENPGKM
ncbi:MAG: WG repeat-containing protein [Muribaculaceae bacterium]|nr:WG repeat-containing protein [Muribaculaceae bacterium]